MKLALTDRQLWLIIGVAVFIGIILLWIVMKPDPSPPLRELTLACKFTPTWGGTPVQEPEGIRDDAPEVLKVYLDISYPMGGFLPFPSDDSFSGFRAVVQLVPDHIVREFGETTDVAIRWMGVAEDLRDLGTVPRIERRLFNGTETRLHLAMADMLEDITTGRADAAALITDLLATEELTGAMGAAKPLDNWLSSPEVRFGVFDLGLVGVRASYWGVTHPTACPGVTSGVGCWYSERRPGYKRLSGVVDVPFYVLLVGRGGGPVANIGEAIRADAVELRVDDEMPGLEAEWELLTNASRSFETTLACTAHKVGHNPEDPQGLQYALFREETGHFRCARDEEVALTCRFPDESGIVPVSVNDYWPAVEVRLEGKNIVASVDCGRLRGRERPQDDLKFEITAQAADPTEEVWDGWSKETDELEKDLNMTLQLKYFVEKVRLVPEEYSAELEPILRAGSHEP